MYRKSLSQVQPNTWKSWSIGCGAQKKLNAALFLWLYFSFQALLCRPGYPVKNRFGFSVVVLLLFCLLSNVFVSTNLSTNNQHRRNVRFTFMLEENLAGRREFFLQNTTFPHVSWNPSSFSAAQVHTPVSFWGFRCGLGLKAGTACLFPKRAWNRTGVTSTGKNLTTSKRLKSSKSIENNSEMQLVGSHGMPSFFQLL